MALPQDFLLQLHDRNEITELVGGYVELRRRGHTHMGLCPFHNEKTPSFVVYPATQSFYCFGCGAGGDAITFIKLRENLDYIGAVRFLAARAGMAMPEDSDGDGYKRRRRILDANRLAARFFFSALNSGAGKDARGYLRRRGLADATIKKFGVGYAPPGWDGLKKYLNEKGYSNQELVEAGLCAVGQAGNSVFDFFRERVMFPVFDLRGDVVAFSGRTMGGDSRKYINTRDTAVFKKSRMLYALNLAKNTDTRRVIVAEGQMDVIAIHQAGFDNAVAALGTALTAEHAGLISRYADEVVLAYDGDEAGRRATQRALGILKNARLLVRVLEIEGAKDPDEYIKKNGPDQFRNLLDNSGNSIEYELGRARGKYDLGSDDERLRYLKECADVLARVASPVERDLYAGRVAGQTDIAKSALLMQIERNRKREQAGQKRERDKKFARMPAERYGLKEAGAGLGAAASERRIIALLFHNPDLCGRIRGRLGAEDFLSGEAGAIYGALAAAIDEGRFSGVASLAQDLESGGISILSGMLAESAGVNFAPDDADFLIEKIIKRRTSLAAEDIKNTDAGELMERIAQKRDAE
jgi:DNA primase